MRSADARLQALPKSLCVDMKLEPSPDAATSRMKCQQALSDSSEPGKRCQYSTPKLEQEPPNSIAF